LALRLLVYVSYTSAESPLCDRHIGTRPIFLCRPGQTILGITTDGEDYVARDKVDASDPNFLDNSTGSKRKNLRGDTLGPNGLKFRTDLLDFCYEEAHVFMLKRASVHDMAYTGTSISGLATNPHMVMSEKKDPFPLRILTSTMPRAADTVNWDDYQFGINQRSNLNPLDKGDFAGMELEDIRKKNPRWYSKLEKDPFATRYVDPARNVKHALFALLILCTFDALYRCLDFLVASRIAI
jgi:hypothetical protein